MKAYIIQRKRKEYGTIPKKPDAERPGMYISQQINKRSQKTTITFLYKIDWHSLNNLTHWTKNQDEALIFKSKEDAHSILERVNMNRKFYGESEEELSDFYGEYTIKTISVKEE